jgi:hypothetical protein
MIALQAKLPRTTNSLEGFHRSLDKLFETSHPDLGIFGEKLQEEHLISKQKILHAMFKSKKNKKIETTPR